MIYFYLSKSDYEKKEKEKRIISYHSVGFGTRNAGNTCSSEGISSSEVLSLFFFLSLFLFGKRLITVYLVYIREGIDVGIEIGRIARILRIRYRPLLRNQARHNMKKIYIYLYVCIYIFINII